MDQKSRLINTRFHLFLQYFLLPAIFLLSTSYPTLQAAPLTPDKSITIVNQGSEGPEWKIRWDEARELAHQQKHEAAVIRYLEVLEEKPHIEEVKWELCKSYMAVGMFPEALVIIEALIESSPDKIDYLVTGGEVALEMGREDQASRYFGRALALDPGGPLSEMALLGMVDALNALDKKALTIPLKESVFRLPVTGLPLIVLRPVHPFV